MDYGDDVSIIEESFRVYWGTSDMWLLYIGAIVFILLSQKTKEKREMFVWYIVLIMFVILNPFFGSVMQKFMNDTQTYIRVYYLLPVIFTIAYAGTEVILSDERAGRQHVLCFFLIIIIFYTGESYYEKAAYISSENEYKIPEEEKLIADTILSDVAEDGKAYALTISWDENWNFIRQYTNRIVSTGNTLDKQNFHDQGMPGKGEVGLYLAYMDQAGYKYDYVLAENVKEMIDDYEILGHEVLLQTGNYVVIKINR